jgi:hypothetical protein
VLGQPLPRTHRAAGQRCSNGGAPAADVGRTLTKLGRALFEHAPNIESTSNGQIIEHPHQQASDTLGACWSVNEV